MRPAAGMTIREPMTMATDYLLALVAWAGAARVLLAGQKRRSARSWGVGLLLGGAAAAVGGSLHGFAAYLAPGTKAAMWQTIFLLLGAAGYFVLAGALEALVPDPPRRSLLVAARAKLAFFAVWTATLPSLRSAIADAGVSMLAVLVLLLWRKGSPGGADAIAGILVGVAAAALQQARVSPHELFNHNDLSHVVLCGSLFLLARAGLKLRDLG
jgi:hypothetical protein